MKSLIFNITVIGSGPAGIAAIGVLLSQKVSKILWVDPEFNGGRMPLYTKVPSNTTVCNFTKFISECEAFKKFEELEDKAENPLVHYLNLYPEKTCSLDLCLKKLLILTNNIRKYYSSNVLFRQGYVKLLVQEKNKDSTLWKIHITSGNKVEEVQSHSVIMATGSKPKYFSETNDFSRKFGVRYSDNTYSPQIIDLDTSLDPEQLQKKIKLEDCVAVIGSSHSSMVVIKNLTELKESPKKIICFYIEEMKFAEYMPKGWILNDNTGLKGDVADWVKNYLQKGKISKVEMNLIDQNQIILKEKIPSYTKIIYTIGFERNSLPELI